VRHRLGLVVLYIALAVGIVVLAIWTDRHTTVPGEAPLAIGIGCVSLVMAWTMPADWLRLGVFPAKLDAAGGPIANRVFMTFVAVVMIGLGVFAGVLATH
jgi:hypothetical protein